MSTLANPYLRIQDLLTQDERVALSERMFRSNPQLRGADVADLLDIADNNDAFLAHVEHFLTTYPTLKDELGIDDERRRGKVLRASIIAGALLARDDDWIIDLATRVAQT